MARKGIAIRTIEIIWFVMRERSVCIEQEGCVRGEKVKQDRVFSLNVHPREPI